MSLRLKLVVIILFVALVPLSISALMMLDLHSQAFDDSVSKLHREKAAHGASIAQTYFEGVERNLSLAVQAIRWQDLSDQERNGALWLVYRQMDDIAAVTLLDQQGEGLSAGIYHGGETEDESLERHPKAPMSVLQGFAQHIPFADGKNQRLAVGKAFVAPGAKSPLLPLAFRVDGKAGATWVVAACLSLRNLCANLKRSSSEEIATHLIDPAGRSACRAGQRHTLEPAHPSLLAAEPDSKELVRLNSSAGSELIAAVATTASGWRAVSEQPMIAAFASNRRMRTQTILFICLGIGAALFVGLFLSQSITGPVKKLVEGALELAKGNFSYRISMAGRDELGRLSETFNHMGTEVEKRDREIREWNEDLQQRVDERTRELKEAQEQLLQSQKISAVTALGAGIAHEVNNPLTGVIGLTQVMMTQLVEEGGSEEHIKLLKTVEHEALRVKGIVRTLLTFSQNYAGESFSPVNVHDVIEEALEVIETDTGEGKIEVVREFEPNAPKILGNRTQLQQVFLHLMNNSCIAMRTGGRLMLSTSSIDGKLLKISVTDTGKGISPENLEKVFEPFFTTKDDWRGEGLGLTVAFRIIQQHHGSIKANSKVGEGTTMTVTLPAARIGAHIA